MEDYFKALTAESDRIDAEYDKLSTDDRLELEKALKIWKGTRPDLLGSLVDVYLRSHQIIPTVDTCWTIRFHPSCPFTRGIRVPCMVALYSDIISDVPKAVHLTPLNEDGSLLKRHRGQRIDRKIIGPYRGCAIKLCGRTNLSLGLTIGYSVENTLAHIDKVSGPAWVVTEAKEIACFPVLPGVERLTLLDKGFDKTDQYVTKCAERWASAGVQAQKVPGRFIGAHTTLVSDAEARAKRFAICDEEGNPVWCTDFSEWDSITVANCKLKAANKAIWLASKIKERIGADAIKLTLNCNAARGSERALRRYAGYLNVVLEVIHIPSYENPARPLIDARESKAWHGNDWDTLATLTSWTTPEAFYREHIAHEWKF